MLGCPYLHECSVLLHGELHARLACLHLLKLKGLVQHHLLALPLPSRLMRVEKLLSDSGFRGDSGFRVQA